MKKDVGFDGGIVMIQMYRWGGEKAEQTKRLMRHCIALLLVKIQQGLNHTGMTIM